MTRPETSLARELEAALAFWQAAGVSHDFHDDATAWLAEAPLAPSSGTGAKPSGIARKSAGPASPQPGIVRDARSAPAAPPQAPRAKLLGDSPPPDLATFRDWWMTAPGIASGQAYPRIAPRGEPGAALLVLVPQLTILFSLTRLMIT
jgi:DNA polymerase